MDKYHSDEEIIFGCICYSLESVREIGILYTHRTERRRGVCLREQLL